MDLDGRANRAITSVWDALDSFLTFEVIILIYISTPLLIGGLFGFVLGRKAPTRWLMITGAVIALPSTLMIVSLGFFTLPFGLFLLATAMGSRLRGHAGDLIPGSARAP